MTAKKRVLIIGGGFGGLNAAKNLRKADIDLIVIDRANHHLFQPLLYQVATAALSPANIATPIRDILRKQQNTSVLLKDISAIDKENRKVIAADGMELPYDTLIVATGARHDYFGHPEWEPYAPGLKTIADAILLRDKILLAFERAEWCQDLEREATYLRFVIIGGGPTGVELAGAVSEIACQSLFNNFRRIKPEQSEIVLIEGLSQLLPSYPKKLADDAQKSLEKLGVHVMTNTRVTNITHEGVYIGEKLIPAATVIWAAGNDASPLLKTLNLPLDKQGRAIVEADLSIPGHPEVFVIGDANAVFDSKGNLLPGIAPVAIQQGKYVANLILKDSAKRKPFVYHDKGMMATIGRAKAVAVMGRLQISGFFAWLAWGLIHIYYLIGFQNRLFLFIQWLYLYIAGERKIRIITRPNPEEPTPPLD